MNSYSVRGGEEKKEEDFVVVRRNSYSVSRGTTTRRPEDPTT